MDVCNMVVEKPLIATGQKSQLFRASATVDWTAQRAVIQFYSVNSEGRKTVDHAKCVVRYGNRNTWLEEWKRNAYMVKACIEKLVKGVNDGQSHKLKRGMAYKLFSALVQYDQKYRGMEEVILDSAQLEATGRVKFQATEKDGSFYCSPYWIDCLGHLSGFVMNANDAVDSKTQVYVNHGWESMRCSGKFSPDKTYQTYVKMQLVGGTMFAGDVYIFDENSIVAVFQGVKVSRN